MTPRLFPILSIAASLLTKIWYASAYRVKASLVQDYFGAILMDRGDRISWTGDAHRLSIVGTPWEADSSACRAA
jgi:hypothetical protein